MEKFGFIYIWRDRKHNKYYVGSHWGEENDGYVCSSFWMKRAHQTRSQDFKRRILKRSISKQDLCKEEHYWLSLIKKEELGKRYYNLRNHRFGHWSTNINKTVWNKGKTGLQTHSEEYKKRLSIENSGVNNYFYGKSYKGRPSGMLGKKHSEETRKKMSGHVPWNKGLKNGK